MWKDVLIRWALSFAIAAWFMRVVHVGWLPVIMAGVLTLGITIAWRALTNKRRQAGR